MKVKSVNNLNHKPYVVVIGGGFTGLAAAYEITRRGIGVTILEKDEEIGGLAGSFRIGQQRLEKFYHHLFNNDRYAIQLVKELGCEEQLVFRATRTGVYFNNKFHKLSTPFDVLRFKPLSLLNRIRLGLLALRAGAVKNWKQLETLTAKEWLLKSGGREVYRVVWEPLLRAKFGPFASEISAVWFWNKLVLRGGSRTRTGKEFLAYYYGSFSALAEKITNEINSAGGMVQTSVPAKALVIRDGCIKGVQTPNGVINAQAVIATAGLPIIANLLEEHVSKQYIHQLRKIKYLSNMCLVLELAYKLSDTYWLNINDGDFPFVGLIEHTNFQPVKSCGGRHIVYLSKYLPETSKQYQMTEEQFFEFSLPYIKRMFPEFDRSWVHQYHVWKARYAQPIVERYYGRLIPTNETPVKGFYIATMAQIYPEDRGINYAIKNGRGIGKTVAKQIQGII